MRGRMTTAEEERAARACMEAWAVAHSVSLASILRDRGRGARAMGLLRAACYAEAHAAGHSKAAIARAMGVDTFTVINALRRRGERVARGARAEKGEGGGA